MDTTQDNVDSTDWSPERKIVGGAIAVVLLVGISALLSWDPPLGLEGAVGILAGYFLPNKK